jgi:plastocyanin
MQAKRLVSSLVVGVVLALAVVGASGCGSSGGDSSSSTTTEPSGNAAEPGGNAARSEKVEIVDFAYNPDPVTIEEGGKVIWHNEDSVAHTATAEDGSFDTGPIEEGKIKSETFKQAGTYEYVCSIHPQMHGTIEVVPAG